VYDNDLQPQLDEALETVRLLHEELAETNRGLLALALELEQRVDERTKELRDAYTALQKTNAEVLQMTAELQAANRELEAFSYSVSHDLQAPLRRIDGFSQLLLEECFDHLDANGQLYVQRTREACQRMFQLIDDILALSRVTRSEMDKNRIDLSQLVKHIAAALQFADPQRQAEFVIAEGVVAIGDVRLLRAALENLLGNAWKFTSQKPQARIEFGCAENRPIYFVRDNGAGFDTAYADKLFGVFQRLHNEREFPGNGIGLATVQRIIHRHGGRIWAEAKVGLGATFYFTLERRATEGMPCAFPVPGEYPPQDV
jgi:light-regulated signal transduction histidine kinase (bacteriophytochrome)